MAEVAAGNSSARLSRGTRTAAAACAQNTSITLDLDLDAPASDGPRAGGRSSAAPLFDSLLVVASGAGGGAGAAGVPSQHVVHLLPQLLGRHLQEPIGVRRQTSIYRCFLFYIPSSFTRQGRHQCRISYHRVIRIGSVISIFTVRPPKKRNEKKTHRKLLYLLVASQLCDGDVH